MDLRLFDSRAQAVLPFRPLVPGRAGIYVCGPTVQSSPHIGHLRSALVYDVLRRWLDHRGFAVTMIRNVTDIDDKVLEASSDAEPWWALAYRVELEFQAVCRAVGVQAPTYEPRATANIDRMQGLIASLIDRGHAYPAADGSGDVYFSVASWPEYGELTRQRPEDMVSAEDSRTRRDPRDFALWKGHKPTEPESAAWASPWGAGRPGWHIECSAMAERYLGPEFDIHGGGLDLRFPHHENELAQSSAAGLPFARVWMHNGLVTVGGQKMSKSLGNSVFAADLLGAARPVVVRYSLISAQYRSQLDHHERALAEAEEAVGRIGRFLERGAAHPGVSAGAVPLLPDAFAAAMDDDLGVPQALGVLHETVRAGNVALDADDTVAAAAALGAVRAMAGVLGIDPSSPEWTSATDDRAGRALDDLLGSLIADRRAARDARDWAVADRIRTEVQRAGIELEDGADGTRWTWAER